VRADARRGGESGSTPTIERCSFGVEGAVAASLLLCDRLKERCERRSCAGRRLVLVRSGSGGGLRKDARFRPRASVWDIVFDEPVGSGPLGIGGPLGRVLPRHRRRSAHTDPARPSNASQTRAPHRSSPPRGGCRVGRCGGENSAAACACWLSAGKGVVWVVADPAGRTSASDPKATEARPRRGAELEGMIETRGA
jgi:hypothetical protein